MSEQTQVYLEDHQTGELVNLSRTEYSFRSDAGNFTDRFTLLFSEKALEVEENQLTGFSIYPNPAKNSLNLVFGNSIPDQVRIFDLSGRLVTTVQTDGKDRIMLNIGNLSTGLYFVKAGASTKKLLVE